MKTWGITNAGLVRSENQDAYAVFQTGAFHAAVVCDGMGGTNGGRVASAIAVSRFEEELRSALRETKGLPTVIAQSHSSSMAALRNILDTHAASSSKMTRQASTSRGSVQAALAGLVEGSYCAGSFVCGRRYF